MALQADAECPPRPTTVSRCVRDQQRFIGLEIAHARAPRNACVCMPMRTRQPLRRHCRPHSHQLCYVAQARVFAGPRDSAFGASSAIVYDEARSIALDISDEVRIGLLDVGR